MSFQSSDLSSFSCFFSGEKLFTNFEPKQLVVAFLSVATILCAPRFEPVGSLIEGPPLVGVRQCYETICHVNAVCIYTNPVNTFHLFLLQTLQKKITRQSLL